ncbi:MAG: helix-turn-helix domain-containing protein [Tenericutes bacterium]|nr:helix-turn-helix domain-containing protein [Mycoplasmatota bacterium]
MQSLLKLRDFREKVGLNQREIAKLFNMSQTNYCNLEIGKSQANAKQIIMFCDFFKCTPNDLFGFKGVHTVVSEKLDQ